jgi:hypothetical protein
MAVVFASLWEQISGGWAFVLFIVLGFPASMLSLHLRHPRWLFDRLERR